MTKSRLTLVAINIVVFVVLAELAAVAFYFFQHRTFFYTAEKAIPARLPETGRGELSADVLHPYFGPIHRPGVRPETNNIGFGSKQSFPYARKNDREFLVGIFGGSVARAFCDRGTPRLVSMLRSAPSLAGREIVPLCFSHEGYKQPQQLLVLAYFLSIGQTFDVVVNIDGFNEVALGSINDRYGWDVSMPSHEHLDPLINLVNQATLTPEKLESLATIQRLRARLTDLAARAQRTPVAAVHVVRDRLYRRTVDAYSRELGRFNNLPSNSSENSLIQVTGRVRPRDESALIADMAAEWARASSMMNELLAARGVPYVHVLQPNQYFTTRRFSADEARVALSDESPYRAAVARSYPALIAAAASSAAREHFVNATTAFDREPSPVYMDNCCHYTRTGNLVLADFIARSILTGDAQWLRNRGR